MVMKKLLAIILTGIFLFNTCGYYFAFLMKEKELKEEMKHLIHSGFFSDQYETLVLNDLVKDHDFHWIDNKEFRYHGKLFDIIDSQVEGNVVILRCINDKKEDCLISRHEQYRNLVDKMNIPGRARNNQLLQNFLVKYAVINIMQFQSPVFFLRILFGNPEFDLSSVFTSPDIPPPKLV